MSLGFLAPIFFVTAGFEVTFDVFQQHPILLAGVIAAATVAKIVGTALFYLPPDTAGAKGSSSGRA